MNITGWGRFPRIKAKGFSAEGIESLIDYLNKTDECIVYGLGRSYGDSALSKNVIFTHRLDKILDFDSQEGIVTCESGVSLSEIIQIFLPRGWFLPVTPGTKFVTVGGAIASDVHGKNHHKAGCFSEYLLSFDLMLPCGEIVHCSQIENRDLFLATCGGMGLTGIILAAKLQLKSVRSAYVNATLIKCRNLKEIFQRFEENHSASYSVAWVDCLAKNRNAGRSILMLGEHAEDGQLDTLPTKPLSIPFDLPDFILNKYSVSLFNLIYYSKHKKRPKQLTVHLDSFFYPLDSIANWNRMYGHKGFIQYQCVFPKESSYDGINGILQKTAEAGLGSFLAVLKLLGPQNENYLSFPLEGYTLALDFKLEERLFPLLNKLDQILSHYAGRLYLAKDARMNLEFFQKTYRNFRKFSGIRESYGMYRKFNSAQSLRLGL